jgi:hypothetical protein
MSRITLTTYPDGSAHVVVGWDHPAQGAFWQEFASTGEIDDAEHELSAMEDNSYPSDEEESEAAYKRMNELEVIANTGVKRTGGMWPGLPLPIRQHIPDDLKLLISDEVETLLLRHADDPESGRINITLNTLRSNDEH